jgi:adenylate cyclase
MARSEADRAARRVGRGALVGAAAAVLAAALWLPGVLDGFEATTFDLRARLLARPAATTDRIATILLDQYSLGWASDQGIGWPWPRSLYGMIADFCGKAGAKAFVLDVLYTEETNEDVAQDQQLAAGITANGKVVAAMNLAAHAGQGGAASWPKDLAAPGIAIRGLDGRGPAGIAFPWAQFPLAAVAHSAAVLANTNLPADAADGVYRREPLFSLFDGRVVPSEALAAWSLAEKGEVSIAPGRLLVGGKNIPIDDRGRAILRYRGPSLTYPHFTAAAVLQAEQQLLEGKRPDLDPAVFKDKFVLFGFTAPGLFDLKPTPMAAAYPGVEVNATMLDNLLAGDFLRSVPAPLTALIIVLVALGAAIAVSTATRATWSVLAYALFLPAIPAAGVAAYAAGVWLPIVPLELAALFALMGASVASYATEGRQKRYIKGAFRQYLSPAVIDELIAHPDRLRLGGERRDLTIFFSDVQGFTSISEVLSPEDLTALLNEYLSAMTDIIQEEGGTIDKYEGDAIIAFWNAPLPQEDHAVRCVRASLRCQTRLAGMRPSVKARIGKDMYARIGVNSGPAVVGNMGSKTRFDYTMLGDNVNLASRLEGVNKQFGTYIMISQATVDRIGGAFPVRELSRVAVVGRKEPVRVYEPMLPAEYAARKPTLDIFAEGLSLYYAGGFAEAARIFATIEAVDPPARSYLRKCAELARDPEVLKDWLGVWVMTEK